MKYTTLGRSGLDVSRICLGCMGFGGETPGVHDWAVDEDASRSILKRALELGVTFFDTANVYSIGTSEEIVGRAIRDMANRDEVVLATKVYFPMRAERNARGLSRKSIMTELDNSLRRLGTDYIDLYQIHRWDNRTPIEETMAALDAAVTSGKVRYIGASSMWAWQFSKAQYVSEMQGWSRFISMQNHYSLLHREEEREMLPLCEDQGVGTIPWSPLARGLLTRPWGIETNRTASDTRIAARFNEHKDKAIVDRLEEVAEAIGRPMAQVAMAWVLANPVVASPIVGATKVHHLEDAVEAVELDLSDDHRTLLEEPYTPRDNVF